jgi:hypothetical protein
MRPGASPPKRRPACASETRPRSPPTPSRPAPATLPAAPSPRPRARPPRSSTDRLRRPRQDQVPDGRGAVGRRPERLSRHLLPSGLPAPATSRSRADARVEGALSREITYDDALFDMPAELAGPLLPDNSGVRGLPLPGEAAGASSTGGATTGSPSWAPPTSVPSASFYQYACPPAARPRLPPCSGVPEEFPDFTPRSSSETPAARAPNTVGGARPPRAARASRRLPLRHASGTPR